MCTRFYMEMSPELRPYVEQAKASSLENRMVAKLGKPMKTESEIRPADMVPVIASNRKGERSVFPMVWGYNIPKVNHPVMNARVESAPIKDCWKDGWLNRRCIIPASWYYEWEHFTTGDGRKRVGAKYLIQANGSAILFLAGLYRWEEYRDLKYPVFSVLTREPTEELSKLHDRMPLMLPESRIDEWIKPETNAEEMLKYAQTEVIVEKTR